MAKKKIITVPNPILKQKTKQVLKIDKRIASIINDLRDTLKDEKSGVGLAAPQIGYSTRICLIYSQRSRKVLTLINPEIVWKSKRISLGTGNKKNAFEGCLSVPKIWGLVKRHKIVKIKYLTPTNQTIVRKFKGFTAVIVQHEIDHLDGILFIDRIMEQKGKFYHWEKNKEGKEELVEMELT